GGAVDVMVSLLRINQGGVRNPAAPEVLVELAGAVGLDPARAKAIVESREFEAEVRGRERHWIEQGVSGVPFILVNDAYAIEGAQPPEAFERAFLQVSRT